MCSIKRTLNPTGDIARSVMNLQTPHYSITAIEGRKFRRFQRAATNCISIALHSREGN